MRSAAAFTSALALSACGALQRPEVGSVALASRVANMCALDIEVTYPAVHTPSAYILGSQKSKSTFRFYVPELRGAYTPNSLKMTRIDSAAKEEPSQWHYGSVTFQESSVKIELFEKTYDTVKPWPLNGTYEVSGASACSAARGLTSHSSGPPPASAEFQR